ELLRTLGFAESPSVLLLFSFIPVLGGLIGLVVGIWTLVASFIGTRQALDIDNTKTVLTIIIGVIALFVVVVIVAAIVGSIFGLGLALGRPMSPLGAHRWHGCCAKKAVSEHYPRRTNESDHRKHAVAAERARPRHQHRHYWHHQHHQPGAREALALL